MAGLYIHIPFCGSKCGYCDFYSMPCNDNFNQRVIELVSAIITELKLRITEISEPIDTIYIGGGTPSLLPFDAINMLVSGIGDIIDTTKIKEWTFEANPEDVAPDLLSHLRNIGVNRISIGIQSFDDKVLNFIGRRHDSQRAIQVLKLLKSDNWNFSADLIFGLPFQSFDVFKNDILTLLSFSPPHFSAYLLSIESETRFGKLLKKGEISEVSESLAEDMYKCLIDVAKYNGYEHYEISNYSLPGYHSRHNSSYWEFVPYLGLGPAAHSFDGVNRRYNSASIADYLKSINAGKTPAIIEPETLIDRFNDYIFTSLRTSRGFNPLKAKLISSDLVCQVMDSLRRDRRLIAREDGSIAIPEQSYLVSDAIIRDHLI